MSNPRSASLKSKNGELNYVISGTGNRTLLTFHGFGQDHRFMMPLDVLGGEFQVFYFDLPHHGKSSREERSTIEKSELVQSFDTFFESNTIDRFSIGAFSLGGKFLFTLLEGFSDRIDNLFLLAPDGIRTNIWYRIATMNRLTLALLRSVTLHPEAYLKGAAWFQRMGWMDKSLLRFVETHMDTVDRRELVYRVWRSHRRLRFNERRLIRLINQHGIQVLLYLGKYDRVIPEDPFEYFISKIEKIEYVSLDCGHQKLIDRASKRIVEDFQSLV